MITAFIPVRAIDEPCLPYVMAGLERIGITNFVLGRDSKSPPSEDFSYKGEIVPQVGSLRWMTSNIAKDVLSSMQSIDSDYILKCDADIFIRSRPDWLDESTMGESLSGFGHTGHRHYVYGGFYCIHKSIIPKLIEELEKIKPLPLEDIAVSRAAISANLPAKTYYKQFYSWYSAHQASAPVLHVGEKLLRAEIPAKLAELEASL